jgi:CRP-like cAMP-binding protein
MEEEQLEKLADVMFEKKVKAGETVIKQGKQHCLFVCLGYQRG